MVRRYLPVVCFLRKYSPTSSDRPQRGKETDGRTSSEVLGQSATKQAKRKAFPVKSLSDERQNRFACTIAIAAKNQTDFKHCPMTKASESFHHRPTISTVTRTRVELETGPCAENVFSTVTDGHLFELATPGKLVWVDLGHQNQHLIFAILNFARSQLSVKGSRRSLLNFQLSSV